MNVNLKPAASIDEVVANGLCIGCGLCEAMTQGRVQMHMTERGSLRPQGKFSAAEEARVLAACPGVALGALTADKDANSDEVWGQYRRMAYAWAGSADIRFRAATGGVLTALAVYLLRSKAAAFILHTVADESAPMRSRWTMSETPAQVLAAAGSRYGPCAPLAGLAAALERAQPFAVVAKPCDLSAVSRLAKIDKRVNKLCVAQLTLVCGGQSRLSKSQAVLDEYGIAEREVTLFRYRGYGNPGRTRIETKSGKSLEKTYNDMWADEAGWQIETRCKFCADALGDAADIAAADVWDNGTPTGEDDGINGIIIRSKRGQKMIDAAQAAGDLIIGAPITPQQFNGFQPHQVNKKQRLLARFDGLRHASKPTLAPTRQQHARLVALSQQLAEGEYANEVQGTLARANKGRFNE